MNCLNIVQILLFHPELSWIVFELQLVCFREVSLIVILIIPQCGKVHSHAGHKLQCVGQQRLTRHLLHGIIVQAIMVLDLNQHCKEQKEGLESILK